MKKMGSCDDLFSSFTQKSKKFYVMQKWDLKENDYLNVVLSDCTNFWFGNCIWLNFILFLIFKYITKMRELNFFKHNLVKLPESKLRKLVT